MIPRLKPYLGWRELVAALAPSRCDDVELFEQAFAAMMGQKYAVAFPYGRTGLILLLEALGLKNREIICPAYTCVVVPHAIVTSGNTPVFVDSQEDDFNMNLDLVPEAITEKTGAIIATSIFGYPVNLDQVNAIRQKYPHIPIIQDCAHSFAAEWQGRPVQKEGVAALFGLNISKIVTSVFGGMVTTDDEPLYQKLKVTRDQKLKKTGWLRGFRRLLYLAAMYPTFWEPIYGMINSLERSGLLNYFVQYYDESKIEMPGDYLHQMCRVEARVGQVQIAKYEKMIQARRNYGAFYRAQLKDTPGLRFLAEVPGTTFSQILALVENREEILRKALEKGVQLGIVLEYCIPNMKAYKNSMPPSSANMYPYASYYAEHVINLPVSGQFRETTATRVVTVLKQICGYQ